MFLVNSRLGLFSATPSRSICAYFTLRGVPLLPRLRGHFAEFLDEGSLARLGILTSPTCVGLRYGHWLASLEVFLDSLGFSSFATWFRSPSALGLLCKTVLPALLPTALDALFQPRAEPSLLCHPILQTAASGIGLSTDCPSPTPFGLGLGPGLLWADEPSPEILRLSADRILTCLFAYLYRHSLLYALHSSLRYCFAAHATLPYPTRLRCRSFGARLLAPLHFRRRAT